MNKPLFYKGLRALTGPLDPTQVKVVEAVLDSTARWPVSHVAYVLATAWHEARLRPIREVGKGKGRAYGKPGIHKGQVPYGRGLVQLTWDTNYERADAELGLDGALIANFDLALEPRVAVPVLVRGMQDGWFTGKSLRSYLPDAWRGTFDQFKAARRIINGTDRNELIAGYALTIQAALYAARQS